ncbi:MMPL family transporter [Sulfidibacter corallicola]|uniref:MMPL family transporter n=1 Tax=Sulfidibacter corallicola TaxID=2818388 RepID=A0A8A4TJ45_SULCO|nr:MMPL family transporter [Sulfidibacter corallicola]QTD49172.1 MMPL family transporter [Sulfidibacter corallicola]
MKTRFWIWNAIVLLLVAALVGSILRGVRIETNILALLPATEQDPVVEQALRTYAEHVGRTLVVLVGHERERTARAAATLLADELAGTEGIAELTFRIDEDLERAFFELYFPYRFGLLDGQAHTWLTAAPPQTGRLLRRAERALYSPLSSAWSRLLEDDPLLFLPHFWQALPRPPGSFTLDDGLLRGTHEGRTYYLMTANLDGSAFSRRIQQDVSGALDDLRRRVTSEHPGSDILATGVVLYAADGAASAESEVSTIGVGSLLGVVLLVLLIFRSGRPILLSLLPIAVGLLTAFVACFAVFGEIHMLTLGFGASLIGICIDYSFHFFAEQLTAEDPWTPAKGLRHIFPGITLGAVTSVLGYLGLFVAPFPGLRQMALFSSVGLIAAYLTVVCWFPAMASPQPGFRRPWLWYRCRDFLDGWQRLRGRRGPRVLLVALVPVALIASFSLTPNDDIRILQQPSSALRHQEGVIRTLSGGVDTSRFLVVRGATPEEVLQREETLQPDLQRLVAEGALGHAQGITTRVPSARRQNENLDLLRQALFAGEGEPEAITPLAAFTERMGFDPAVADGVKHALFTREPELLTVEAWLASPASKAMRHLWLGEIEDAHAAVVFLSDVHDDAALAKLEARREGVAYVDKVRDTNNLFQRYRVLATRLVTLSYVAIWLLLMWRYGLAYGSRVMLPPVLAALATLAIMAIAGKTLNLFGVLALLLVLGIGVDYTIFFAESRKEHTTTMMAIFLSACTTVLSFGLLALSRTPVLHLFGWVVWCGIMWALLLAPLAGGRKSP